MCEQRHGGGPSRLYDPAPLVAMFTHLSDTQTAYFLGIPREQYQRYRTGRRWMQMNTADRLALAANVMPWELWSDFGEPCCEATKALTPERRREYIREYNRKWRQRQKARMAS